MKRVYQNGSGSKRGVAEKSARNRVQWRQWHQKAAAARRVAWRISWHRNEVTPSRKHQWRRVSAMARDKCAGYRSMCVAAWRGWHSKRPRPASKLIGVSRRRAGEMRAASRENRGIAAWPDDIAARQRRGARRAALILASRRIISARTVARRNHHHRRRRCASRNARRRLRIRHRAAAWRRHINGAWQKHLADMAPAARQHSRRVYQRRGASRIGGGAMAAWRALAAIKRRWRHRRWRRRRKSARAKRRGISAARHHGEKYGGVAALASSNIVAYQLLA